MDHAVRRVDVGLRDGRVADPHGVALDLHLRSQTARRLRGRVDVVVGGSGWWSIPPWPPAAVTRRLEAANARTAARAAPAFARLVGAPVVHAAHTGPLECGMPWLPGVRYRGRLQGGALVADAHGRVVAVRHRDDGEGVAVGEVELGAVAPQDAVPERYWLHARGALPALFWNVQRLHGRRWYARHTRVVT